MLSELGWYKDFPFLMLVPLGFPLLINPLFYLYAKYLIQCSSTFKKIDWLHFLPFILYELYYIPDFFGSREEIIAVFDSFPEPLLNIRFLIFNWAIIIQGLCYVIIILLMLRNYSYSLERAFSNIEKMRLNWLRNINIIVAGVWSVFIFENVMYLFDIQFYKIFDIASIFAALLVYSLGYMGLLKSEVFEQRVFSESYKYVIQSTSEFHREKKYEKSGLTAEKAQKYLNQLENIMQDRKPYLNNNLTLNQLADMVSISPHNLSEVINTQLNQNFFDYINQFRVEQVKRDLVDPTKQNLTFLTLGLEAGFNSKSSFNAIFKKHTGKTPSEFRKTKYKSN